jgi:DNA-binding Xre family transcriptional regulator
MSSKGGVIVVVSGEDKTGEVFNAIKKHLDDTKSNAKEASDSMGQIGETLKHGLEAAGLAIGVRELVGGFKEMIQSTMEAAVQIGHLSEQTGISAQNLSVLKYAAQATGVDFETLTKGFKKLAVTTYEADNGNKTAAKGFSQLGISVEDLRAKGDDMYGVLTLVADKFHAMPDGIMKSDTAAKIFGARMGAEMIPVLDAMGGKMDALKSQAEALGVVWDEAGIKKMEALHEKTAEVTAAMQGLAMKLTIDLAPVLENIATGADKAAEALGRLMNPGGSAIDQAHRAAQMGKMIPDDIEGAGNPGQMARMAGANKFGLQKELADLEDQHAKKLISDEKYFKQKAALAQKWNQADLKENQAYFAALQDQITTAQSALDTVTGGSAKWQKGEQDELARLLKEQARVMDAIDSASGRIKPPTPPPPPGPGGSGKGSGSRDGQPFTVDTEELNEQSLIDQDTMRRAVAALDKADADAAAAWDKMIADADAAQAKVLAEVFKAHTPTVMLAPSQADHSAIDNEAEKFAHGIFDPLFNLGEKWNQQWKQIRANVLRDLGQTAESQLFGALFGDSSGKGGKGWDGSGGDGKSGHNGLINQGIGGVSGLLGNLFGKKSGPVSNGTGNAGAGTVLSSVAGALQVGKGAGSGTGGVQVILNNMGTPQTVDSTQQSSGQAEAMILQVVLKDQETNGAITQGFSGMFGH